MTEAAYPGRRVPRVEAALRRVLALSALEARATVGSRRERRACGYVCEAVPDRDAALAHAVSGGAVRRTRAA